MKFASQQPATNGTAALALLQALLEHLQHNGTITATDRATVIERAKAIAPSGVGISDVETQAILKSML